MVTNSRSRQQKGGEATRHTQDLLKAVLHLLENETPTLLLVEEHDLLHNGAIQQRLAHDVAQLVGQGWNTGLTSRKEDLD